MTAAPIIRIVDDDPNIHDALAYVLENEGFIVRHYEKIGRASCRERV